MRPNRQFNDVTYVNWTHNRSLEGKTLWGTDNRPTHWWEGMTGSFNGILVIRQNPEKTTYNITYKDHSTDRFCNEPHYDKAVVTAIEMIELRMNELGVKTRARALESHQGRRDPVTGRTRHQPDDEPHRLLLKRVKIHLV